MEVIKIFLAASVELEDEVVRFGDAIRGKNNTLAKKGLYFELQTWRDHTDRMVKEGLQHEYNQSVKEADLFVLLAKTRIGEFTQMEFDEAYQSFVEKGSPFIFTYFSDTGGQEAEESVDKFKNKLAGFNHYFNIYTGFPDLWNKFNKELDRLTETAPYFSHLSDADNFNRMLTVRIMKALAKINVKAEKLLKDLENRGTPWETDKRCIDQIKVSISKKFIGILGTEIGRLMAIGKDFYSDDKLKNYIAKCHRIALISIQLIAFTFISRLWNRLSQRDSGDISISVHQNQALKQFFDGEEMNLMDYSRLIEALIELFKANKLSFPIPEINEIEGEFSQGSALSLAFRETQGLQNSQSPSIIQCDKAERHISTILEKFIFLTDYEMISIKSVSYDMVWEKSEGYFHHYTPLGTNKPQQLDIQSLVYDNFPVQSNGVLLYKGSYMDETVCTNLYPFVIDLHTLLAEPGNKVCFFNQKLVNQKILSYLYLEMNEDVQVEFKNILLVKEGMDINPKINEVIHDKNNRIQLKVDNTFRLYAHAAKTVAGLVFDQEPDFEF